MATTITGNGKGRSSGLSGCRGGGCGSLFPVPSAMPLCDCRAAVKNCAFIFILRRKSRARTSEITLFQAVVYPACAVAVLLQLGKLRLDVELSKCLVGKILVSRAFSEIHAKTPCLVYAFQKSVTGRLLRRCIAK